MYLLSVPGYIIIFVFLMICLFFLQYFYRRIKKLFETDSNLNYRKYGSIILFIGSFLTIASLIIHIYLQIDIMQSPALLRPITEMTSEPVILITILSFLTGFTTIIIGLFYFKLGKNI
jgi:hypothetical protein